MGIKKIHKLEKACVTFLNIDGWDLKWSGEGDEHYDAKGKTPKGLECVIEMKFRNTYYEDKMLEEYKYKKLMEMEDKLVKLYLVVDPQGYYLFWLNKLIMPKTKLMYCPDTTLWTSKKLKKSVYLLSEQDASLTHYNDKDNLNIL